MAKRRVIGSVCKSKDPLKPPYLKVREGVTLQKDQIIRVESAKFQLESLERTVASGKLSGEMVEQIRERISKIPDWVIGEAVVFEDSTKA